MPQTKLGQLVENDVPRQMWDHKLSKNHLWQKQTQVKLKENTDVNNKDHLTW